MNWNDAIAEFTAAVNAQDLGRISLAMDALKSMEAPNQRAADDYEAKFWEAYEVVPGLLEYIVGVEPGYYSEVA